MSRNTYICILGAASGGAWFIFPLLSDSGWALPGGLIGRLGSLMCAMLTGLAIAYSFRSFWVNRSVATTMLTPFITLPSAITLFSFLIWCLRKMLGITFSPLPEQGEFRLILEAYVFYGLLGAGPLLYVVAILHQLLLRYLLKWNNQPAGGVPGGTEN